MTIFQYNSNITPRINSFEFCKFINYFFHNIWSYICYILFDNLSYKRDPNIKLGSMEKKYSYFKFAKANF